MTATTKAHWDGVYPWTISYGYTDLPRGEGRTGDHPVHSVTWDDVVKWCNAASEKEGWSDEPSDPCPQRLIGSRGRAASSGSLPSGQHFANHPSAVDELHVPS